MPMPLTVPPVRDTEILEVEVGRQHFRVVYDHATEPTDAPPLLLMNGIGARLELLQPLVDHLSPTRAVIRFDAPGVGGSSTARKPYRFRGLAKSVAAVLDQLDVPTADVLGISWGGGLAQQFAYTCKDRVNKLVLVSTATGAIMVPAHPRVLAKMITHRRYTDPDYLETVAHELYGGSMRDNPADAVAALRAQGTSHNSVGYFMQLGAGLGWTSVALLPRIRCQTLVMTGNDDPIIPSCNGRIIAGLLPHSELIIFDGGHLSLVTEARIYAPQVEEFLDA